MGKPYRLSTAATLPALFPELFVNGVREDDVRFGFDEKPASKSGQQRAAKREAEERTRRDALYAKHKDSPND